MPLLGLTLKTSQSSALWVGPTGEPVCNKALESLSLPHLDPSGPGLLILELVSSIADPPWLQQ